MNRPNLKGPPIHGGGSPAVVGSAAAALLEKWAQNAAVEAASGNPFLLAQWEAASETL